MTGTSLQGDTFSKNIHAWLKNAFSAGIQNQNKRFMIVPACTFRDTLSLLTHSSKENPVSIPVSAKVQIQNYSSLAILPPDNTGNYMAKYEARLLLEEKWSEIQKLDPVKTIEAHNAIEARALLLEVLCPEPLFFHNQNYCQEVNTFNQVSAAFRQLAEMCGLADQTSRVFRRADGNTAQVTFKLGGYEITRYTFDLSGGGDLRGVDLSGADLTEVDLTGINLSKADLTFADLSKANLTNAILTKATLDSAILIDTWLIGADLSRATLTWAKLIRATLTEADLSKVNLYNANLTKTNLTSATLTEADLSYVMLNDAILTGTDLTGAELTGANLTETDYSKAIYNTEELSKACRDRTILGKKVPRQSYPHQACPPR